MTDITPPLNPYINDVRSYIRFDPDGRIRGYGKMAYGFIYDEMMGRSTPGFDPPGANPYIMFGDTLYDREMGEYQHWVNDQGKVVARPALDLLFDSLQIAVNTEARSADVPAGTVTFAGPVSGSFEHPGGPLEIGWSVPGTYRVTVRTFPALPATVTFTVEA